MFDETFGSSDQKALARRGLGLWRLLGADPRFGYFGRAVLTTAFDGETAELTMALARVQGASSCGYVPDAEADGLAERFAGEGFVTDGFAVLRGADGALDAARARLAERALPADVTVSEIGPESPPADLADLADVAATGGVLAPHGAVMRGLVRPALCLLARDGEGRAIATAGSVQMTHAACPIPGEAWWGMLATRPERQGEGIALVLGAMTLLGMARRHGIGRFMTGVRAGNAVSAGLCAKLGVIPSGFTVVSALDPAAFPGGRLTK